MLDPEQMQSKLKEQQEDDARTSKMLGAIPNAFDFTYLSSKRPPTDTSSSPYSSIPAPATIRPAAKSPSSQE